jgi:preprotein translocase subunit SecE
MGSNRWVHLMFIFGGLLMIILMTKTTDWVWGIFTKPNDLAVSIFGVVSGSLIAFLTWRNKNIFTKASEIVMELKKVTWPTRKETSAATLVVIVTVIIASFILGIFDLIWSWATGKIYT